MFEYQNGFRKAMYWSKAKMEAHALKYSKGYAAKKGYTFWEKDFDAMACKTMLRQIISKWGIMSIELQQAYERDETFSDANNQGKFEYAESIEADANVEAVEGPKEEKKTKTTSKKSANKKEEDPFSGTPFADDEDVPDFVAEIEGERL